MPSFSNEVKKELVSGINDKDKRFACLYGILLYCRNLSREHISFTTESAEFAEMSVRLIKSVSEGRACACLEKNERKNGGSTFTVSVKDREHIEYLLENYKIKPEKREINLRNILRNSLSAFLAGVFFICGSVSDPYKEYHLEFTTPVELLCSDLHTVLLETGIDGKITTRKGMNVLYVKDSENIEDILTFIGAQQSTIDLMNIKIYKDVRNRANRLANCDTANIDKVIRAAVKQTEDIKALMRSGEYDSLPAELREVAVLRLGNPEMTLQEIGEQLSKPIGRSGVARRFQKIAKLAGRLTE